MRYWFRKTLKYGGILMLTLIIYGAVTLMWSLLAPWKNYQWNNSAIHVNGTVMQQEIREFPSQDGNLYAGYILVQYNSYWSQLCAVEDTPSRLFVEQVLANNFSISSNVTIYYHASAPSEPHLGPKSILDFVIWLVFNGVLFMGLMTIATVLIHRDHKNSFHAAEHIPLYGPDSIKNIAEVADTNVLNSSVSSTKVAVQLGKQSDESEYSDETEDSEYSENYTYDDIRITDYLPQSYTDNDVKLNSYIPASYNL